MFWPLTIFPRWSGHPLPSSQRFDGLTILVAGSSSTMGLEAAKKLAAAGASTLVVTARTEARAQSIKTAIEAHLNSLSVAPPPTIIPLTVEMTSPTSIHAFIHSLSSHVQHLDHAILNAGTNESTHSLCATGYETSIQVNAISTTLLGLSLLPLLLASPNTTNPTISLRPHLVFVSSGTAWLVKPATLPTAPSSTTPMADLSTPANWPPGTFGGQALYSRSKLCLEYAMRHLAFLPVLRSDPAASDSPPRVLVTSCCPGPVATNLARSYTANSWVATLGVALISQLVRAPEVGANIHVSALGRGEEARGEMWKDDVVVSGEKVRNVKEGVGRELGERVWREMKVVVKEQDQEQGGEGLVERMLVEGEERG
ncbi:uncharacterized protein HMPREF1541_09918 [Cyphellophora europaea CBS 101466]|uniref:NAD(P)-binding protein n=1 Tax=Cyphellophora europaea (strain CBS 101466) TaxID=1220924 RepID=W2S8N7_CYPE1|nr:uncharacterized protein HMPREF1541_09918 [Cyphellophora europaea CBS 101466]ETN45042.1 hypothetical protein HMPREF1541_09918 [Cyphellophora europaea CBS 101466]